MMIITGTRPYGKCDVVPELFYVATWFFHVNFLPLIPLGTRLVLGQQGDRYQVIHIPFSFKSLLYAWTRVGLFGLGLGLWVAGLVTLGDGEGAAVVLVMLAVLVTVLYLFVMIVPRKRKPSYKRACELGGYAQLNQRGWAALNVLYGRDPLARPGEDRQETDVLGVGRVE